MGANNKPPAREIVITIRDTDMATGKVEIDAQFTPALKPGDIEAGPATKIAFVMFRAAVQAATNGGRLLGDED